MMKNPDSLFNLIHSMSASEKAYFKKQAGMEGSKRNDQYFKLFDLYDKAQEFDKEQIQFKTIRLGFNQPATAKHRLHKMVLHYLVRFNKDNIEEYEIFERLLQAKLLLKRGFTQDSLKELEAAEKLNHKASITEVFPYIYLRQNYYSPYDPSYSEFKVKALAAAQDKLDVMTDVVTYETLSAENIPLVIDIGTVCKTDEERLSLEKIIQSPLLTTHQPKSKFGHIMKQHLTCFYSYLLNDIERAYLAACKAISLFEGKLEDHDQGSLQNLSIFHYNAIQYAFSTRNEKIYNHHLSAISNIKSLINSKAYKARIEGEISFLNLNWLIENKAYQEAKEMALVIAEQDNELYEYNQSVYSEVHVKIPLAYFHAGDYNRAIDHINNTWQDTRISSLPEEKTILSLIEVFSHLKLENMELARSRTRSLYRNLSKQNRLFQFEKLIVRFINDLYKTPQNPKDRNALKDKYLAEVSELKKLKNENFFLELIDLESWLQEMSGK